MVTPNITDSELSPFRERVHSLFGDETDRWAQVCQSMAEIAQSSSERYRSDPLAWAESKGIELWSKQRDIFESVAKNAQTAVASCHSIGKSFIAALVTAWWIDVHPPGEAFVFTTAPTGAQVKAVLWREINKLHTKLNLTGRTNLTEWYIGNELVAFGRKPDEKNPTAAQGTHARYFLAILDEACGVPKSIWDATSTLTANEFSRTLAIGNPDDATTEFANVCLRDDNWNTLFIGYEDTPNFTGENVTESLRQMLTSVRWVAERMDKWGEDSALFMSKCRGRFPVGSSPFVCIPLMMAERCRHLDLPLGDPVEAGIDVAAGGDRTVLWERRGRRAGRTLSFRDADPMRSVGQLAITLREWGVEKVKVDSTGLGWGIAGRLTELSSRHKPDGECVHSAEVVAINFASGPTPGMEHRLLNKRAELWWNVGREYSRLGTWDIGAIDDDTLQELTTPLYVTVDSTGKIKIELKDEVIKRLGRSPDSAEALLLAFLETSTKGTISSTNRMDTDLTRGLQPGSWANNPMTSSFMGRRGFG